MFQHLIQHCSSVCELLCARGRVPTRNALLQVLGTVLLEENIRLDHRQCPSHVPANTPIEGTAEKEALVYGTRYDRRLLPVGRYSYIGAALQRKRTCVELRTTPYVALLYAQVNRWAV